MSNRISPGILFAFCSAVLFGMSAPLGKLLLNDVRPVMLAGLLYLGSSAGITLITLLPKGKDKATGEAPITRNDYPVLGIVILSGGVIAPILLFCGLSRTPASIASLLLNTEAMLTTLLAAIVFHEWIGRRVWLSAGLMLFASLTLMYAGIDRAGVSGPLLVVAACLLWGIDNNVTSRLAHKNPYAIARLKGLVAGLTTLLIACGAQESWPGTRFILCALLLGAFSYGASLVLFVYALRYAGVARTATWFQTAPFVGAFVSIVFLGDRVTIRLLLSALIMMLASALLLREHHAHQHRHEELWHEHRHEHDEHHRHHHETGPFETPHAHPHYHAPLMHAHTHFPDVHHRHNH